jgi:hypothetical protein
MYYNDFDRNGFPEGIIAKRRPDGKYYPYALRHNLVNRLPHLKKIFPDFESFKQASMTNIFTPEELEGTVVSEAYELRSIILENKGNFNFTVIDLPDEVQLSPVYAIQSIDVNDDGYEDLVFGGNLYSVQPEMGRYDASYGNLLINNQDKTFKDRSLEYGFKVTGEIRDFAVEGKILHVFRNNDSVLSFEF